MTMYEVMKLPYYDQEIRLLIRLNLLKPRLECEDIICFIEYQEITIRKMRRMKSSQCETIIGNMIKIVIENMKQELGHNFIYLVKKCAFLHLYLHQVAQQRKLGSNVAGIIEKYLREVLDKDIKAVVEALPVKKEKTKREGSLNKIYNAVRSLSKSRQEINREKSNLKFQNNSDKSALKEMILKLINPWVLYMLKLVQDPQTYSRTLTRSFSNDEWVSLKWKLYNELRTMGSITYELNRLGKYFKQDLIGAWVFINYVLSTDIANFYNTVAVDLSRKCQKWKEKIIMVQKLAKINKTYREELREISQTEAVQQVKRQAENLIEVKEKIIYLYHNTVTVKWDYLMVKPFKGEDKEAIMASIEFILDFLAHQKDKESVQQKLTPKIKRSQSNNSMSESSRKVPISAVLITQSLKDIEDQPLSEGGQSEKNAFKSMSTLSTNRNVPPLPRKNNFIEAMKQRIIKP